MIIDFRIRPPFGSFRVGQMYADPERTRRICNTFQMEPSPVLFSQSLPDFFAEMNHAEITLGVIPVRRGALSANVPNQEVADFVHEHPDQFVGFASPDPDHLHAAADEVIQLMQTPEFRGIVMEPGLWRPPLYLNDRRLYPIYEVCQDRTIPVLLMAGGSAGPDITYTSPVLLDRVAADFPRLTVIAGHGGWPWVSEILHVAWRYLNVYLSPDMYVFGAAGWRDYVDAGNGFLQDRFLFATSFPFVPLRPAVDRFMKLFRPQTLPKLLGGNAMRVLKLGRLGAFP